MRRSTEDLADLHKRLHWTIVAGRATFAPADRGWRAVVRRLHEPTTQARFHVAILDRRGTTCYVREAADLDDAVRHAERDVIVRKALRLVH
jgi:hypothetical protein